MSGTSRALRAAAGLALAACSTSNNTAGPTNDGGGLASEASPGADEASGAVDASGAGDAAGKNPDTAPVVSVDRFSDAFAHLFKRSANPSFPAANAPIDCDQGPFITRGLGPDGEKVTYYNFDVLPTTPAPIYVFFAGGTQVAGQLNVVDVLPGDPGYNDFWLVTKVTVPSDYVANSVTSLAEITAAGFATTPTTMLVNCPVVPAGSTAKLRYTSESSALQRGWYRDKVVNYFSFDEHALMTATGGGRADGAHPRGLQHRPGSEQRDERTPSGFVTELGTMQTHNVISVLPATPAYSPLWTVSAYKSASFSAVDNWTTASQAPVAGCGPRERQLPRRRGHGKRGRRRGRGRRLKRVILEALRLGVAQADDALSDGQLIAMVVIARRVSPAREVAQDGLSQSRRAVVLRRREPAGQDACDVPHAPAKARGEPWGILLTHPVLPARLGPFFGARGQGRAGRSVAAKHRKVCVRARRSGPHRLCDPVAAWDYNTEERSPRPDSAS